MRAYTITSSFIAEDCDEVHNVLGITSSRKSAIDACEAALSRVANAGITKWQRKDKHDGTAFNGDHTVSYQMFFVNQINESANQR